MKLKLFVVALSTSTDAPTNRLSLFHILEELQAATFPVVIGPLTVFAHCVKEAGDPDRIDLVIRTKLSGAELFSAPVYTDFGGLLKTRIAAEVQGFVVPGPGDLTFSIEDARGVELGNWVLEVTKLVNAPSGIAVQANRPTPLGGASASTANTASSTPKP